MELDLYKKMYATVCAAADRAIDLLSTPESALQVKLLLEQALLSAEEMYLHAFDE
jgi:hypothetical protein